MQEVAFVEAHDNTDVLPATIEVGFAPSEAVGAGGVTITAAFATAVPYTPVQDTE